MMVLQYRGKKSLIFANVVRDIIKAPIVFNTRKLKTCLPSLKPSFPDELKSKVFTKFHVVDFTPFMLTNWSEI